MKKVDKGNPELGRVFLYMRWNSEPQTCGASERG